MQTLKTILRWVFGVIIAAVITLALFLILPVMQAIGEKDQDEYVVQEVTTIQEEPPPDFEEPDPPEEDEPEEEEKPELETEPLVADISQLDLALDGGGIGGLPGADTTINIDSFVGGDGVEDLFDGLGELDQDPRVLFQAAPKMTEAMRRKTPATVVVIFIVDERGRVQKPMVQSSSDAAFDRAAINAVKQWRFEPGKSKGKPVESRMRIPITFPKE